MKKLWLIILLPVLLLGTTNAQLFYIGGGENFSFLNNGSLDFVIHRYNDTRSYLTTPLSDYNYMRGGTVNMGVVSEHGLTLELAWVGRHITHYADGVDNTNTIQQRDVKLRNNTFNIGFGYTYTHSVFCPGLLVSFDFGSLKSLTRSGLAEDIKDADYQKAIKDLEMGMTFTLNLMIAGKKKPLGFAIRPYYQVQFIGADYQDLNYAINPATADSDLDKDLIEANSNFGVQVVLLLAFRKD